MPSSHDTDTDTEAGVNPADSHAPPDREFAREVLIILIEECAEVIHRTTKALRFGLDEIHFSQLWTNSAGIGFEVGDLYATLNFAIAHRLIPPGAIAEGMTRKEDRLTRFMRTEPPHSALSLVPASR